MPAGRVCTRCPAIIPTSGMCARCRRQADKARGTAHQRGYTGKHLTFRAQVLARDPVCVLCHDQPSTDADHWPRSKRELDAAGLDSNRPEHGRGLCQPCHAKHTALAQPGGWNQ